MAKLIFEGITLKQARELAYWFEGQGEQEAAEWFDIAHTPSPTTIAGPDWITIDEANEIITLQLTTP